MSHQYLVDLLKVKNKKDKSNGSVKEDPGEEITVVWSFWKKR
jgi:hypothetical protein